MQPGRAGKGLGARRDPHIPRGHRAQRGDLGGGGGSVPAPGREVLIHGAEPRPGKAEGCSPQAGCSPPGLRWWDANPRVEQPPVGPCRAPLFSRRRWCGRGRFKGSESARVANARCWLAQGPAGGSEEEEEDAQSPLLLQAQRPGTAWHTRSSRGFPKFGVPHGWFFFFFLSLVLAGSGTEPRGAGGAVWRAACPALAHPHVLLHTLALPCMCSQTTLHASARTCTLLHTPACPCTCVHTLECFGMFLHVLARIRVLLRVRAHMCVLLHALTRSGVLLHVLASTCLLLHALACPCSCAHALTCPCTLLCACLPPSQTPACAAEIRVQRKVPSPASPR